MSNFKTFKGTIELNFSNFIVCNTFENKDKGLKVEVKKCKEGYQAITFLNDVKTNEAIYNDGDILIEKIKTLLD